MKWSICIFLMCICQATSLGQHIFMPTAKRKHVVDSLGRQIGTLTNTPGNFRRDTNLFHTLDRYFYHFYQLNPHYTASLDLQSLYADSMFRLAKRNHWKPGIAIASVRQARAALNHRQDSTALKLFQHAVYLCKQQKLAKEQGMALIHMATCLAYRPNVTPLEWQQATRYMKQALDVAQVANDAETVFQYYNFMGDFHIIREDYKTALQYYTAVIPVLKRKPHLSGNRTNLAYLGICHLHIGHSKEARRFFSQFFTQSNPDEGAYATYLHHIVLYEISQYHLKQRHYATALHYLQEYGRILSQRPPIDHYKYHKSLTHIYEKTGNYKLALFHQRQFQEAQNTIRSEEASLQFASLEARYQLIQKDNQIQSLESQSLEHQHNIQKTRLWLLIIVLLFISGILGLLLYSHRLRRKKIQSELQIAEIQNAANAQIIHAQESERQRIAADLHDDLGGVIATINHQLTQSLQTNSFEELQKRLQQIQHVTAQAGDKVRNIAHNLMPPDFERIGLLESVHQLVTSLNDTRFQFATFGEPKRLAPQIELNAYRILSELIHNVQKHAQAKHIYVQLLFHADSLSLVVDDNGIGNKSAKNKLNSTGIGLKNISSRVNYLGAHWYTDTSQQGTTTLIEIPYDYVPGQHSDR